MEEIMLAQLKTLLGERAAGYSDEYLTLLLTEAEAEALAYTRRDKVPAGLQPVIPRMALVMVNRTGSEGVVSQGLSGVSESYLDGWPAEVLAVLRRYRRIGVMG